MTPAPRILIVDDEADVRRYLAAALEDEGFEVVSAADAEEGAAVLRADRPDLVCLDLVLPGRTGLSLYRELRTTPEWRDVPVIVITGLNPADAQDRLGLGETLPPPDALQEKPVDLPALIAAVRRVLGTRGRTA